MPLYAYRCRHCGYTEDVRHAMSDDATTRLMCPTCRRHSLRKKPSAVPAIYKTGGFYKTDSRKSDA